MIQKFWNDFLKETGRNNAYKGTICFGESLEAANAAAKAAACGKKILMTYPENGYRTAMKGMPKVGDLNIVVDWSGEPACVIETVKVSRIRFCDMEAAAYAAEMNDAESWQETKEAECKRELEELGAEFDENIMLVAEEFRSIYRKEA